jgi:tRNA (guanine-N7-)-methyltransferase
MRLRNKPWAAPELSACPYYLNDPFSLKGKWKEQFQNDNPIWLEIGCGKGLFIAGIAPDTPEINFIGSDIKSLMLAYARRNIEDAFGIVGKKVDNVRLLPLDAERINLAFSKEDSIDRIIINFPNPWPKEPHKKRRLTHTRQLVQYHSFMADNAEILFKTDSDYLFQDSLEYFKEAGFSLLEVEPDYYSSHSLDSEVLTEHEQKFLESGLPIHFIRAGK